MASLPRVVVHNAVSVDGALTGFMPDMELYYRLAGAFAEEAILSGADTVLAGLEQFGDDMDLFDQGMTPEARGSLPLLVVTDSRGRVRVWDRFMSMPFWRAGVALCSRATPDGHLEYLRSEGIDPIVAGEERVDLRSALTELAARYGVKTVRTDTGGALIGALLSDGLVDELSVLVSPVLAGPGEIPLVSGDDFRAVELELVSCEELAGHVHLRYGVSESSAP